MDILTYISLVNFDIEHLFNVFIAMNIFGEVSVPIFACF